MTTASDLKKLINRFSCQAICDTAIFQFPEITLGMIKEKYDAKLSKINIVAEILYIAESLPREEINARYSKLKLLLTDELTQKTWYVWKLKLVKPVANRRDRLFRLKEYLEQLSILADFDMISLPEKYLFRVTKQVIIKGQIKNMGPIEFQYFLNQPYLFCARKLVQTSIIRGVVGSLGYDLFRLSTFTGTNVLKLLHRLARKHDAMARAKAECLASGSQASNSPTTTQEANRSKAKKWERAIELVQYVNEPFKEIVIPFYAPSSKRPKTKKTTETNQSQIADVLPVAPVQLQNSIEKPSDEEVVEPASSKLKYVMPVVLLEQFIPKSTVKLIPRTEVDTQEIVENYEPHSFVSRAPSHSQELKNEPLNKRVVVHKIVAVNQPQYETVMHVASSHLQPLVKEKESVKQKAVQSTPPEKET